MKTLLTRFLLACMLYPFGLPSLAADDIETHPIQFAKGASSATIKGSLKGYQIIDYKLRARAGQTMTVSLNTDNTANYFNVIPPGSNDVAVYIGSTGGNDWSGPLTTDGEYTLRVYQMRSAARRKETAHYTLTVGITGNASASLLGSAPTSDGKVAGTPYHATGTLPCSMGDAAPNSLQCDFGVIRGASGNAEVHVTPPGGFKRILTFMGEKVSADNEAKIKANKNGDDWLININDYEHYRIPEAVIFGG